MTVRQLIAELQTHNQDAVVVYPDLDNGRYWNIDFVAAEQVAPWEPRPSDADLDDSDRGDYTHVETDGIAAVAII